MASPIYTTGDPVWNSLEDNTRLPLTSELESGWPCGGVDPELLNFVSGHGWNLIHNMLTLSGLTPSIQNLHQLAQAIQSGKVGYVAAGGTANALTATLSPVPASVPNGMAVRVLIGSANTGAATLNVNSTGALPIVTQRGVAISQGELAAGAIVTFVKRAAAWQLVGVGYSDVKIPLSADLNLYVATTGSDSNDGLTAATPFATLQKAWDYAQARIDLNGFNVVVNVAAGTYTAGLVARGAVPGQAGPDSIKFVGNPSSPSTVVVDVTNGCAFRSSFGANFLVDGFLVRGSGTAVNQGYGLYANGGGIVFRNVEFGAASVAKMGATAATLQALGPFSHVAGAAPSFFFSSLGGVIQISGVAVTFVGSPAFSDSVAKCEHAVLIAIGTSFSGAGGVTGKRYAVTHQGWISTNGAGASFFPGSIAGTADATSSYT